MKKDKQDIIIEQLRLLNGTLTNQSTVKKTFLKGIVHGVGFFVGSAILATILLGFLGPWVAEIDWVRENFERGSSLK